MSVHGCVSAHVCVWCVWCVCECVCVCKQLYVRVWLVRAAVSVSISVQGMCVHVRFGPSPRTHLAVGGARQPNPEGSFLRACPGPLGLREARSCPQGPHRPPHA